MICTFLRSSMLTTYALCQHKSFIEYNLGIKPPTSKSATVGNVVHKVMELLARRKLAIQNNEKSFNDDLLGIINIDDCQPMHIISLVLDKEKDMSETDKKDCIKQVKTGITSHNGIYDPRNCEIVAVEHPFDYVIDKPWAKYSFDAPGGKIEGQLMLRGTIDLVIKHDDETYELRDYKTGRVWDWAKNQTKDEKSLYNDIQLNLYYYAACQTFPNIKNILFTIYFIKYDQPFLIAFDRSDLPKIENMLAARYKEIVNNLKPKLNISFRCKFCHFSKVDYEESGQTICQFFKDQVIERGIQKTMNEFGKWESISHYGVGGNHDYRQ